MSALAELSIFPIGKGESVSSYVARAVTVIAESGLDYRTGPMGTVIEGDWQEVIDTVSTCMKEMQQYSDRVYLVLKVDWRNEPGLRMSKKIDSLAEKMRP